ncbi:uncharacterized protein IL334_003000 [Kwoniella shivajii]|uniref:VASt domain-containing protein n=1 Tax=Kwoniella shivajii TaxID=564305 RepID=A0ABZ1CWB1_9TREE|nr:hypothetical protein IL334_003000 [Kwoniella shivajii]
MNDTQGQPSTVAPTFSIDPSSAPLVAQDGSESLVPLQSDQPNQPTSLSPSISSRHRAASDASTLTTSSTNVKAVSPKRQADFEKIFGDKLLAENGLDSQEADFLEVTQTQSADLQSTILIHGRLYLTRYYLCFRANILGVITERIHPLKNVVAVEKGTTAKWIQNAVYVKVDVEGEVVHYGYGSMADRDTMYAQTVEWWSVQAPERYESWIISSTSEEERTTPTAGMDPIMENDTVKDASLTDAKHTYGTGERLKELAIEEKIPLDLEQAYQLLYHNAEFTNHLYVNVKKLTGKQDRKMTYVMHMSNPLGPSKSDCVGTEAVVAADPNNSYEVEFKVQTRTCLSHTELNGNPATRIHSTTQVNWSGSSFLKSTITPAVIKGQKEHYRQVVDTALQWINSHREDFGKSPEEKVETEGIKESQQSVSVEPIISAEKSLVDHAADIPSNPIMIAISALCALLLFLQLYR